LQTIEPIRVQPTIYDALRGRDSSDEDADKKLAAKKAAKKSPKVQRNGKQPAAPVAAKKTENDLDSILSQVGRLSNTDVVFNLKIIWFFVFIVKLNVDDLEQEHRNFISLYPGLNSMALRHIASYLNLKLSAAPEQDPKFSAEDLSKPFGGL
jgi:hypothetical protein